MKLFGFHIHRNRFPWSEAPPWALELREMLRLLINETEFENMATKEHLDALAAQVAANTDATASAKLALEGFVKSNEDLTKQLQDALAKDDDAAVSAAVDAITANNNTLRAAIPQVAAAVPANTAAR